MKLNLMIIFMFISFLILSLSFGPTTVGAFSGTVVSILDGDTIEVMQNQHPERIRLYGIDCPEKGQAFGKRQASLFSVSLC